MEHGWYPGASSYSHVICPSQLLMGIKSKYHHLSDRTGGKNAPDLNIAAQSVLNTKQDGIKWMHSGFYDCH